MGQAQSQSDSFLKASKQFTPQELDGLRRKFRSIAHKSRSSEELCIFASAFQAHYEIHGVLGARLYHLLSKKRGDGCVSFEDFVEAKALARKGSPEEKEALAYSLLDIEDDGCVRKSDLEAVVTSCVKTVLGQGPDQAADEATVAAIVRSAQYSEAKQDPCMSLEDFRKWSRGVPAVRRVLESLMADPEAGGQKWAVPDLVVPSDAPGPVLLKREHAWLLGGALTPEELVTWRLAYSSKAHGLSFSTFVGKTASVQGPSVLVVRDAGGALFGGFASQPWERRSEYYGDMHSFLFTLLPQAAIFRPSGANRNLQWCAINYQSESLPNGCGFGGQVHHFGLFLDASFDSGESRPCVTFNSPSLSSSPRFTPDHIECWAVEILGATKGGDQAALKGTVLERFKEDRAVLNMMGIANQASAAGEG